LEITDDHTFKLYLKYAKEMAEVLGVGGLFSTAKLFFPETIMMLTGGIPKLILLVEFEGDDESQLLDKVGFLEKIVGTYGLSGRFCKTELEVSKYWKMRRDTFKLLREKIKTAVPAPFIDDLIVRPEFFPKFLPRLTKILDESEITYTISGHLGDGNLHIIPLMDLKRAEVRNRIEELTPKVYDLVLEYHGSLSAEHNDGLIRSPFLEKQFGHKIYQIFEEIKKIFDPDGIFNPGKKVGVNWEEVRKYIRNN
jgi:FAD/FMN-containing dehydrogenase